MYYICDYKEHKFNILVAITMHVCCRAMVDLKCRVPLSQLGMSELRWMCQLTKRQKVVKGWWSNHLSLGKVHWMTCFQCMLSKGTEVATSPFFMGCRCSASQCFRLFQSDQCTSWGSHHVVHRVYNAFLVFRGYHILGVHKHVPKGAQWTKPYLNVQGCEDSFDNLCTTYWWRQLQTAKTSKSIVNPG